MKFPGIVNGDDNNIVRYVLGGECTLSSRICTFFPLKCNTKRHKKVIKEANIIHNVLLLMCKSNEALFRAGELRIFLFSPFSLLMIAAVWDGLDV